MIKPSIIAYKELQQAYDFFNEHLFNNETGQQMTHYIMKDGLFQQVVYNLLKSGFEISWYDKYSESIVAPVSKVNYDILIDWLNITPVDNIELIKKLTKTVNSNSIQMGGNDDLSITKPILKGTGTRDKFTCPDCGLNAWAKPTANLICGDCNKRMENIKFS
ncbi:hypothetical protein [Gilliamella sp. Bif1-4]|uniref:hypothetical protein n=1 Tax=Gilliamella sp. Bif1-4 TaxID=3120233 RepID=UPI00080ECD34|nr:hypothetical protein [Gilliamella apicola]OCG40849.1 hypothetical protein A9G25_06825 [Gilliamella apicola]